MSLLVYTLNWPVTGYCVMLPLKELKDYQFCIIGGWGDLKGTFRDNCGHWRPLEALGLSTSYWFGR